MRVEAMPIVGLSDRIPGPIGGLEILENDTRLLEPSWRLAPDIEVAFRGARMRLACPLKPAMLIRGMIDHELGYDPELALVRLGEEGLKIL